MGRPFDPPCLPRPLITHYISHLGERSLPQISEYASGFSKTWQQYNSAGMFRFQPVENSGTLNGQKRKYHFCDLQDALHLNVSKTKKHKQ
jgi:hypothetical protein